MDGDFHKNLGRRQLLLVPDILPVSSALREALLGLLCSISFCYFPFHPPPSPYTWFSQLQVKCSHQTLLLQPTSSQHPEQGKFQVDMSVEHTLLYKVTPAYDNLLYNIQEGRGAGSSGQQ